MELTQAEEIHPKVSLLLFGYEKDAGFTLFQEGGALQSLPHYHGDHIGESHRILPDIPVYLGEIATEISKGNTSKVAVHCLLEKVATQIRINFRESTKDSRKFLLFEEQFF